jgi:hypothetical protein
VQEIISIVRAKPYMTCLTNPIHSMTMRPGG